MSWLKLERIEREDMVKMVNKTVRTRQAITAASCLGDDTFLLDECVEILREDWTQLSDHAPLMAAREEKGQRSVPAAVGEHDPEKWLRHLTCEAAAARSALHLHSATEVAYDRLGVRLSYFREFIERCGGRSVLENLSTFEVKEEFIRPFTEKSQLSLCEQLMSEGDGAAFVDTASVFLSFTYQNLFLDVVDAVERHFIGRADPEPVVWFSPFSATVHLTRSFEESSNNFHNVIARADEVVMVVQPWRAPFCFTRAWCFFEGFLAEATHCRFSMIMTEAEANDLVGTVCCNPSSLLAPLRSLRCEATDSRKGQRDMIFATMLQSVGFAQLNSMFASRMMETACAELCRHADTARPMRGMAWRALEHLRGVQGNYAEAERPLRRECGATAGAAGASAGDAATRAHQGTGEEAGDV
jgi:hypothetical protein